MANGIEVSSASRSKRFSLEGGVVPQGLTLPDEATSNIRPRPRTRTNRAMMGTIYRKVFLHGGAGEKAVTVQVVLLPTIWRLASALANLCCNVARRAAQ